MATYHLSVKIGSKGKALSHANYITREDKFKHRQDLECVEHGNMPEWAKEDPEHFWQAADQFERVNGSTYRELEIALPRELNHEQRLELVRDFVKQEVGDRHAYTFAIHNPKASIDGGEQPHAHVMISPRIHDGIERSPEKTFKRYNAKFPERGGAQKARYGNTPLERKQELSDLRQRWEKKHNEHIKSHGYENSFIDSRSLKSQAIVRDPEHHLGFEASSRLNDGQKLDIKLNRFSVQTDVSKLIKSVDFSDKGWRTPLGVDLTQQHQQKLMKSMLKDISQQYGKDIKLKINKDHSVSIVQISKGFSMGW